MNIALPILFTLLATLVTKMIEHHNNKKLEAANILKTKAETDRTDAEVEDVRADAFNKGVAAQGGIIERLQSENQRAYTRAENAELAVTKLRSDYEQAIVELELRMQKKIDALHAEHVNFRERVEGLLIAEKVPLPSWWPHHDSGHRAS